MQAFDAQSRTLCVIKTSQIGCEFVTKHLYHRAEFAINRYAV
jgi:hypothetical protein